MMTTIDPKSSAKFLFETSFDDPENLVVVEEKAAPTYSQEKLDQAVAEAFANGHAQGLEEAKRGFEKQATDTLFRFEQVFQGVMQNYSADLQTIKQKAASIAHVMLQKMFPDLTKKYGLEEIEKLITETVIQNIDVPKLTIRVHPTLQLNLAERLSALAERVGYGGKINLIADSSLMGADCRVEWGDSGVEYVPSKIWQQAAEKFKKLIGDVKIEEKPEVKVEANEPEIKAEEQVEAKVEEPLEVKTEEPPVA
jgi:flagellar biosynthesis/type III secretory pathway protein FliH